jgi:hypothetical protein
VVSLCWRLRQLLYRELPPSNTHQRHTVDTSQAGLELAIVGAHNVDTVLRHPVHDTVVRVDTLVVALQSRESFVSCYPQGKAVLRPQLFQLCHSVRKLMDCLDWPWIQCLHAGCDDRLTLREQGVGHALVQREFSLRRMRDEVGI